MSPYYYIYDFTQPQLSSDFFHGRFLNMFMHDVHACPLIPGRFLVILFPPLLPQDGDTCRCDHIRHVNQREHMFIYMYTRTQVFSFICIYRG